MLSPRPARSGCCARVPSTIPYLLWRINALAFELRRRGLVRPYPCATLHRRRSSEHMSPATRVQHGRTPGSPAALHDHTHPKAYVAKRYCTRCGRVGRAKRELRQACPERVYAAWPWLWAAHPRDAMEETGWPVSSVNCPRLRRFFLYFLLDPEATPRLAPPLPPALSTPCGGARRCAPSPSGGWQCASPGVY